MKRQYKFMGKKLLAFGPNSELIWHVWLHQSESWKMLKANILQYIISGIGPVAIDYRQSLEIPTVYMFGSSPWIQRWNVLNIHQHAKSLCTGLSKTCRTWGACETFAVHSFSTSISPKVYLQWVKQAKTHQNKPKVPSTLKPHLFWGSVHTNQTENIPYATSENLGLAVVSSLSPVKMELAPQRNIIACA